MPPLTIDSKFGCENGRLERFRLSQFPEDFPGTTVAGYFNNTVNAFNRPSSLETAESGRGMALDEHQVRVFLLDKSNELRRCLLAPLSLFVRCDTFISIKRQRRHKEKESVYA